jgi:hypothetical protein
MTDWENIEFRPNFDGSFILLTDFGYQFKSNPDISVLFSYGLRYNGGSVPRIFTPIVPRYGKKVSKAFFIHDLLYGCGYVTRKQADLEMLHLLKIGGVGIIRRRLIYRSVRMFGGKFYKGIDQN